MPERDETSTTPAHIAVASCTASSEITMAYACASAFDLAKASQSWASANEGVGSWITAQFDGTYMVTKFAYQNRGFNDANKGVTLSFSSGASQSFTVDRTAFKEFPLSPAVVTSSVKITVTSTYSAINNGANVISFYGYRYTSALRTNASTNAHAVPDLYIKTIATHSQDAYPLQAAMLPDYSCAACNPLLWTLKASSSANSSFGEGYCVNTDGSPTAAMKNLPYAELGILRDECAKTPKCNFVQYTCATCKTGKAYGQLLESCQNIRPSVGIEVHHYTRPTTSEPAPVSTTVQSLPREKVLHTCSQAKRTNLIGTLVSSKKLAYGATEGARNNYCCYLCHLAPECEFWVRTRGMCKLMANLTVRQHSQHHFSGIKMTKSNRSSCNALCNTNAGCTQAVVEQKKLPPKPEAKAPLVTGLARPKGQGQCKSYLILNEPNSGRGAVKSPQACMDLALTKYLFELPDGSSVGPPDECSPTGKLDTAPCRSTAQNYCDLYKPGGMFANRCDPANINHHFAVKECARTCKIGPWSRCESAESEVVIAYSPLMNASNCACCDSVGSQGEWVVGGPQETCEEACDSVGQTCSEEGFYTANSMVSSAEGMQNVMTNLGRPCSVIDAGYPNSADVPNWNSYDGYCYAPGAGKQRSSFVHQCLQRPTGTKHAVCWCTDKSISAFNKSAAGHKYPFGKAVSHWTNKPAEQDVAPERCRLGKGVTESTESGPDVCTFSNCTATCLSKSYRKIQEYSALNSSELQLWNRKLMNASKRVHLEKEKMELELKNASRVVAAEAEISKELTSVGMSINASKRMDTEKARLENSIMRVKENMKNTQKVEQEESMIILNEKKDIATKEEELKSEVTTKKIVVEEQTIKKSVDKAEKKAETQTAENNIKVSEVSKNIDDLDDSITRLQSNLAAYSRNRKAIAKLYKVQSQLTVSISKSRAKATMTKILEEKRIYQANVAVLKANATRCDEQVAKLSKQASKLQETMNEQSAKFLRQYQSVQADTRRLNRNAGQSTTLEAYRKAMHKSEELAERMRGIKAKLDDVSKKIAILEDGPASDKGPDKKKSTLEKALAIAKSEPSVLPGQSNQNVLDKIKHDLKLAAKAVSEPLPIIQDAVSRTQTTGVKTDAELKEQEAAVQKAKLKGEFLQSIEMKESQEKEKSTAKIASQKANLESMLRQLKARTREVALANKQASELTQALAKTRDDANANEIRHAIKLHREQAAELNVQVNAIIPKLARIKRAMKMAQIQGRAERKFVIKRIKNAQQESEQTAKEAKAATVGLVNDFAKEKTATSSQTKVAESEEKHVQKTIAVATTKLAGLEKQASAQAVINDASEQARIQDQVSSEQHMLTDLRAKEDQAQANIEAAQDAEAEAENQQPQIKVAERKEAEAIDQQTMEKVQVEGRKEAVAQAKVQEIRTEIAQASNPEQVEELSQNLANVETAALQLTKSKEAALADEYKAEAAQAKTATKQQPPSPNAKTPTTTLATYSNALSDALKGASLSFKHQRSWVAKQSNSLVAQARIPREENAHAHIARQKEIEAASRPYIDQIAALRQQHSKLHKELNPQDVNV